MDTVGKVFEKKQEESPGRIWGVPKTSIYEGVEEEVQAALGNMPMGTTRTSNIKGKGEGRYHDICPAPPRVAVLACSRLFGHSRAENVTLPWVNGQARLCTDHGLSLIFRLSQVLLGPPFVRSFTSTANILYFIYIFRTSSRYSRVGCEDSATNF